MSQSARTEAERYDAELLGQRNNTELWRLRCHWGSGGEGPYRISVTFPHSWRAERLDASPEDIARGTGVLEASSATELREAMMADHLARPLPRRPSPPGEQGG
jgi:hypothetical protein